MVDRDALRAEVRRLLEEGGDAEKLRELLKRIADRSEPRDFQLLDHVLRREATSDEIKDLVTASIVEMDFPRAFFIDPAALEGYRRRTRSRNPVVLFSLLAFALLVDLPSAALLLYYWPSPVHWPAWLGAGGWFAAWVLGAVSATFAAPKKLWRRVGVAALRIASAVHLVAMAGALASDWLWSYSHVNALLIGGFMPFMVTPLLGFALASRSATLGKALPRRTR